jgi:ketosteroid isomerase-like protein
MSNAQLATEMLAAYQRADREGLVALVDPGIEIHGAGGIVNAGTFHGVDGFFRWTAAWEDAWEDSQYEIVELNEVSDELVVGAVRVKATGRNSGVPIKAVYGYLWEIRNGKATRFHVYESHDDALHRAEALSGQEEDEESGEEQPEPPPWEPN